MTSAVFRATDIASITIGPDRQRRDIKPDHISELADSISRLGLIHPIVITREGLLVAGECRLRAAMSLGWTSITTQFVDELDEQVLHQIELEENIKRRDISWQDRVRAVARYHEIRKAEGGEWKAQDTARAIGFNEDHVSRILDVAAEIKKGNEKIAAAPKLSTAIGIVQRGRERATAAAVEKAHTIMAPAPVAAPKAESILNTSFLDWAPAYTGPRFNFIHCDFPYGINADKHVQGAAGLHGGYEDSPEVYFELLGCLADNLDRIAAESCHIMFWFSMHFYQDTLEFFAKRTNFEIDPFPLIWHKTDNSGIIPDPERGPRRVYETALFGARGDRKIVRSKSNAYGAPSQKDIHMSIKPQPMLTHFFEMFVDSSTSLLDPTCGSGSALRAAEGLKAEHVLGLERDQTFAEAARLELAKARRLRMV